MHFRYGICFVSRWNICLARAGFQLEHLYAGFDQSPYGSTYPGDLVCVARRVGTRSA